jgi:hypothetical protein
MQRKIKMINQNNLSIKEISNYEKYLSIFFPNTEQTKSNNISAEEIGIKMAEETLHQIRELLKGNKQAK